MLPRKNRHLWVPACVHAAMPSARAAYGEQRGSAVAEGACWAPLSVMLAVDKM